MTSASRLCMSLCVLCVAACQPGSSPPAVHPPSVQPSAADPLRFACFPDGNVAIADLAACTVARVSADAEVWRVPIPGCAQYLEVAVARDSSVFARTAGATISLASDGRTIWSHPTPTVPPSIASPATTLGSLLVLATSPTSVAAYPANGPEAWQFDLPAGETLVTSPVGSLGEGVVLLSETATYFIGADGTIRGRRPHLAVMQP